MDYREAGVDVEAGRAFVDRIRTSVKRTYRSEVLGGLGGFGVWDGWRWDKAKIGT